MVRINARTSLGTAGRPSLPRRTFQAQNRRKPFRCQPMTVAALMIKTLDCQSFQTAHSQAHSKIRRGQFGSFDGALENAELMAESENLELKHRTAAKGSENSGRESRQKMPASESKGERQAPVYQSDRSLREPQSATTTDRTPNFLFGD